MSFFESPLWPECICFYLNVIISSIFKQLHTNSKLKPGNWKKRKVDCLTFWQNVDKINIFFLRHLWWSLLERIRRISILHDNSFYLLHEQVTHSFYIYQSIFDCNLAGELEGDNFIALFHIIWISRGYLYNCGCSCSHFDVIDAMLFLWFCLSKHRRNYLNTQRFIFL